MGVMTQYNSSTRYHQFCLFVPVLVILCCYPFYRIKESTDVYSNGKVSDRLSELHDDDNNNNDNNRIKLKQWKQAIRHCCTEAITEDDVNMIDVLNMKNFQYRCYDIIDPLYNKNNDTTKTTTNNNNNNNRIKQCQYVFLDFGANIGDTLGHLLDSSIIGCTRNNLGQYNNTTATTNIVHFDIHTQRYQYIPKKKLNPMVPNIGRLIELQNLRRQNITSFLMESSTTELLTQETNFDLLGPEDYCYYGIEGNPVFTKQLQQLEDRVLSIQPRPIQHLHFFTETVGTDIDGPTTLYLDTVNTKQNFWGSSLLPTHTDVVKSSKTIKTTTTTNATAITSNSTTNATDTSNISVKSIGAPVMGYTIGTLMKKILLAYDDNESSDNTKDDSQKTVQQQEKEPLQQQQDQNHLIVKIDIEGAEYSLLWSAIQDGTLCNFVQGMGHVVDMYIEYHSPATTGPNELYSKKDEIIQKLTDCGISLYNLDDAWARRRFV